MCGQPITEATLVVADNVPEFMSDCGNCLNRLATDRTKMVDFMNLLHVVCKDTIVLHHVTRLHKAQLKEHNKSKAKWKLENLQ